MSDKREAIGDKCVDSVAQIYHAGDLWRQMTITMIIA